MIVSTSKICLHISVIPFIIFTTMSFKEIEKLKRDEFNNSFLVQKDLPYFISDYATLKFWTRVNLYILNEQSAEDCLELRISLFTTSSLFLNCVPLDFIHINISTLSTSKSHSIYLLDEINEEEISQEFLHSMFQLIMLHLNPLIFVKSITNFKNNMKDLRLKVHYYKKANYKLTIVYPNQNKSESEFIIEEAYGFFHDEYFDPLYIFCGFWSKKRKFDLIRGAMLGPRNFKRRVIRVTTVEGIPVVIVKTLNTSLSERIVLSGFLPDILETMSQFLNFSQKPMIPPDKQFGTLEDNGNSSGMVRQLYIKEADMALMSFSLTAQRKKAMDFSPPVEYSYTKFLVRRGRKIADLKIYAFFEPLHWDVWIAIPIIIIVGAIAFTCLKLYDGGRGDLGHFAWLLSCCFLLQGLDAHSNIERIPFRIALGSFWLLALIVYSSYNARLTASLTAITDSEISLREASTSRSWKIGMVKESSVFYRVKESTNPELKLIWKKVSDNSTTLVSGFDEGIQRVYKESFIFFTSELIPTFLIQNNCSFSWMPGGYFPGFGYMGYQKHLPYAPAFSQKVAQIRETGQMKRLIFKWWGRDSSCSLSSENVFLGMSMHETGVAFIFFIFGCFSSLFFLSLELCMKFCIKKRKSQFFPSPKSTKSIISDEEPIEKVMFDVNLNK